MLGHPADGEVPDHLERRGIDDVDRVRLAVGHVHAGRNPVHRRAQVARARVCIDAAALDRRRAGRGGVAGRTLPCPAPAARRRRVMGRAAATGEGDGRGHGGGEEGPAAHTPFDGSGCHFELV